MRGMGFGLERLGLMALSRPVVFSLLVVLITFVAGFHLSKVKFDGNVLAVIPENSQAFQNYEAQKHSFRNFSRDVAVILRSPDLFTADGLEEIRSLQLELSLEPDVSSVQTLFSVPNPDIATGELLPFFPDEFASDEDASRLIRQLLDENPQAASLVSEKHNAALVFVSMKTGLQETTDREAFEALKRLQSAVSDIAPEEVEIFYAGLTPIGLTILETLKRDQTRLTLIGLVVGALIAWCVFRSAIAAIICAVPPILTVIWSVGIFGFLEMPITYLTTVIPTLALILAYADGIVLFHRWTKKNEAFAPSAYAFHENLREAISRVGPAAALTSITTCIAFLSFLLNDSQPIRVFGMLGAASVLLGFVSVILALPLLTSAFLKIGYRPKSASKDGSGKFFGYVVRSFSAAPMGERMRSFDLESALVPAATRSATQPACLRSRPVPRRTS